MILDLQVQPWMQLDFKVLFVDVGPLVPYFSVSHVFIHVRATNEMS